MINEIKGFKITTSNGQYDYSWMVCELNDGSCHFKLPINVNKDEKYFHLKNEFKKIKDDYKKYALAYIAEYYVDRDYLIENTIDLNEKLTESNSEDIFSEPIYDEEAINRLKAIENIAQVIIASFEGKEAYLENLEKISIEMTGKFDKENELKILAELRENFEKNLIIAKI